MFLFNKLVLNRRSFKTERRGKRGGGQNVLQQ